MPRLVQSAFSRHLLKHPWQLGLAVLGIVVGVAVILAIRLTQLSAVEAFESATRVVTGPASHRLITARGGIDHKTYLAFKQTFPGLPASPVIQRSIELADAESSHIVLFGIDPISRTALNQGSTQSRVLFDPMTLVNEPGGALINYATARKLQIELGATIGLAKPTKSKLQILDLLPGAAVDGGLIDDFILVDIASAQEVLGEYERIDYVDLRIESRNTLQNIKQALGENSKPSPLAGLEIIDLGQRTDNIKRMTDAFYMNLTALSLMALMVGMFLIYNTEAFLVVQRRETFGRLRALGVTRRQLLGAIVVEAAAIGVIGSLGGIVLGVALANALLSVVATTVNDLYFQTSAEQLSLNLPLLLQSAAIGISATVLAALVPAANATKIEPSLAMSQATVRTQNFPTILRQCLVIFSALNLAALFVLFNAQSVHAGFLAIGLEVMGFAALCPIAIVFFSGSAKRLGGSAYTPERLGFASLGSGLNRTGTATAALMIATAASIGIGVMVTSFRASVSDWLDSALRADLYIADTAFDNQTRERKIPPSLVERLRALETVDAVSTVVRREITHDNAPLRLTAFSLTARARAGFRFKSGDPATIWGLFDSDDVILVTEPFAYHNGLQRGDRITFATSAGAKEFEIAGVYLDYASERGSVAMNRRLYDRYWHDVGVDGVGVYGDPDTNESILAEQVKIALGNNTSLVVNSGRELKQSSLAVFDRTFLITELLRAIAVAVSFIGVLGALLAQQLERTREYGVLRAIGFTGAEITRGILSQTLMLGFIAAVIAIPVGILIGVILVEVVNPRSFGWTMNLMIPWSLIANSCFIALAAALAAGLYPSVRAMRIEPAIAMRFE